MPPSVSGAEIEISTLQGGREYQQDRATWHREGHVITAAVADGMGSGAGSGRIAQMAVDFATAISTTYGSRHPEIAVAAAAECVRVATEDDRHENDDTTLVLVTIETFGHVRVAWVGDSRAYVLTRHGKLIPLTKDHNYGPHAANVLSRALLGPDLYHRHGGLDCAKHAPDSTEYYSAADPAVMVALMTDGVCGVLTDDKIGEILRSAPNARRAAKRLTGYAVRAAEAKGEKQPDNATALVIDLDPRTEA